MISVVGPKCCSVMALARATVTGYIGRPAYDGYMLLLSGKRERERELRKEGREVLSHVRLREGPIGVRITLGQPTIG